MDEQILSQAQSALGYAFKDPAILRHALKHASVTESRLASNERLEFLGDSVLGLVVCHRIYEKFPKLLEGEMTKIKSLAVSRHVCCDIARQLGLPRFLEMGKGMQDNGEVPASLAAAALEAVIAAIYIDGGWQAAWDFITPLVDPLIDNAAQSGHQHNFKSVLQQHAQQMPSGTGGTPVYRILDEKGPDHAKCFKICVELNGRRFTASWAQSKKRAEQMAALNALRDLGVVEEDGAGAVRFTSDRGIVKIQVEDALGSKVADDA